MGKIALLLLGISSSPVIKVILFTTFLVVYLIILVANISVTVLVRTDPQLHTPMYFFLSHLSFSDLCYSTDIEPRMLAGFLIKNKSISFYGCALQFLIFCTLAGSEWLLLAVMAYDRYMAISNPLLYTVRMSGKVCSLLMAGVYMVEIIDALINRILTFHLCFCGSNEINHFFCDVPPLLLLSCSDTQVSELVIFLIWGFVEPITRSGLFVSYCYIILAVIKIHSAEGRFKAFSTCTSHLTAVAIFQGTLLFMYFRSSTSYSLDEDKMTSLLYTLVIPMLNPLIYSLWIKDVKEALMKRKNKK
ncbi:olfactory receptor-like protein OLF2 [Dama dama]|uniref:olfactory receptor-like protein OLF2 n=1 Tax=Dama dama TaxID=30532 RepID=UPI002A35E21E|nr:olfactory receptor-like protein OLF2 [Dama dama]